MRRLPYLLVLPLLGPATVQGASIKVTNDTRCAIELTGQIDDGDHAKVEQIIKGSEDRARICLNSDGGSFSEGVEFANSFMENGVGTIVRSGDKCVGLAR